MDLAGQDWVLFFSGASACGSSFVELSESSATATLLALSINAVVQGGAFERSRGRFSAETGVEGLNASRDLFGIEGREYLPALAAEPSDIAVKNHLLDLG